MVPREQREVNTTRKDYAHCDGLQILLHSSKVKNSTHNDQRHRCTTASQITEDIGNHIRILDTQSLCQKSRNCRHQRDSHDHKLGYNPIGQIRPIEYLGNLHFVDIVINRNCQKCTEAYQLLMFDPSFLLSADFFTASLYLYPFMAILLSCQRFEKPVLRLISSLLVFFIGFLEQKVFSVYNKGT